jgi:hypothetical protein
MEMKAGYEPTKIQYEDIAAKVGLDKTSAGRGTAIFDYNNDGLLDIVITAAHAGCNLYRNNGDGTFTDVSIDSGLDQCLNGFVVAAGDYDNDGFVDLFVTRSGFYVGNTTLYHNNGDGTFTDVSKAAGIETWGPGFTASWVLSGPLHRSQFGRPAGSPGSQPAIPQQWRRDLHRRDQAIRPGQQCLPDHRLGLGGL